jgi:hypothetical protein
LAKAASKRDGSDYEVGQMMTSNALARCQGAITDALLEATSDLYDKKSGAPVVPHLCILEQEYVADGTYREQLVQWLDPSTGAREDRRVKDLPLGTVLVTVINVSNSHWAVVKWAHVEADNARVITAFDSLGAELSPGVQRWVNGMSKRSLVVDDCVKMAQFSKVPDSCGPCSINLLMTLARKGDDLSHVWFHPEVLTDRLQFKSWMGEPLLRPATYESRMLMLRGSPRQGQQSGGGVLRVPSDGASVLCDYYWSQARMPSMHQQDAGRGAGSDRQVPR